MRFDRPSRMRKFFAFVNFPVLAAVGIGVLTAAWIYFYRPWSSNPGPPVLDVASVEEGLAKDPIDHGARLELARYYLQWGLALSRGKTPMDENVSDSDLAAYYESRLSEWEQLGTDVSKFRKMLHDDPPGFRNLFLNEERALARGMFERSVICFRQARALGATLSSRDLYDVGTAYFQMGPDGYSGASRYLGEAVANGLVSARAFTFLGNVSVARGDFGEGIVLYKKALEHSEEDPVLNYNLGLAYKEKGDYESAIEYLRTTLRIYQDKLNLIDDELTIILQSRLALGWCLLKKNRHGEAVTQFETLLDAQPDLVDAHYWIGVSYEGLGRIDLARAHWQQAERIQPGFRDVRSRLAAPVQTSR